MTEDGKQGIVRRPDYVHCVLTGMYDGDKPREVRHEDFGDTARARVAAQGLGMTTVKD